MQSFNARCDNFANFAQQVSRVCKVGNWKRCSQRTIATHRKGMFRADTCGTKDFRETWCLRALSVRDTLGVICTASIYVNNVTVNHTKHLYISLCEERF